MFYEKVNKNSNKEMYEFLTGHFTYFTMNSWNREKSIANNVKIYNLQLEGDCWKALEMLEREEYLGINEMINDWENEHPGYKVGFNGKSGGYLVLYNEKDNCNVLDYYVADTDNYEDFKELLKDYGMTLKDYHDTLVEQVELVQNFDKLCDDLREFCQYLIDSYTYNEQGHCFNCNSTDLIYDNLKILDDDNAYKNYECKSCGTHGVEYYDITFARNCDD